MKSVFGVILFSLGLVYLLYVTLIVWIKPQRLMKDIHERRLWAKSHFPYIPDWIIGFAFFYEKPGFSIWWARTLTSIAILICILGIIAAAHGPF